MEAKWQESRSLSYSLQENCPRELPNQEHPLWPVTRAESKFTFFKQEILWLFTTTLDNWTNPFTMCQILWRFK